LKKAPLQPFLAHASLSRRASAAVGQRAAWEFTTLKGLGFKVSGGTALAFDTYGAGSQRMDCVPVLGQSALTLNRMACPGAHSVEIEIVNEDGEVLAGDKAAFVVTSGKEQRVLR
jgi:hypothetical protein